MRARALTGLALANASLVAGCGVSATRTVTRTAVAAPVVITVKGPLQARDISGNSVAVTGTVDPSDATVDVAGQRAQVMHGAFNAQARLASVGTTTIAVIANAPGSSPGGVAIVIERLRPRRVAHVNPGGSGATAGAQGAPELAVPCGPGVSADDLAGCPFAANVQAAYAGKGPGTYPIYNPGTGSQDQVTCRKDGATILCSGAAGTTVWLTG
jgi:hypothetical protein